MKENVTRTAPDLSGGSVLGKGDQGHVLPLVLQGDFEIRAGKKDTKGTNSKCCSHT